MTDLATDTGGIATNSTVLDPGATPSGGTGGGQPDLRDTVADAVAKAAADADKADKEEVKPAEPDKGPDKAKEPETPEKPKEDKPAEKPEKARGEDGKFQGKPEEQTGEKPEAKPDYHARQREQGERDAPPRFLPDAREKWANVPHPVRRDIDTMMREHETETTRYREAAERYEPIRRYDELVRQNGRAGVHETLQEVAELEDLMGKNPVAAINQILQRAGPRKADGQTYSLFELAQAVVSAGQENYQRTVSNVPKQEREDPRITQLQTQTQQLQAQLLATSVITPFKAEHPRYEELSGHIASLLESGMVPASLSAPERLAVAYDMAERLYPPSRQTPASEAPPVEDGRADKPSAATSIKTAPGSVTPDEEPKRGGSARDEVERVIRRMAQAR